MVQKPKSVKSKVVSSYILLFIIAVVSVWFVYNEILKIASPIQLGDENKKIIRISNTIANLYASEATGRNAILTASASEYDKYNQLLDTISGEIDAIKKEVEKKQVPKFDSIQALLERKRASTREIIRFNKSYNQQSAFRKTINSLSIAKDSIINKAKPVRITERSATRDLLNSLLSQQQLDSLSKFVSNDSLTVAYRNILNDLLEKDNRMQYQLYVKERKLLEENRVISDQLRIILASVENEFLLNSYNQIEESQNAFANTARTMAWVGAITFLLLIIFAWIIIRDLTSNQNYRQQLEKLNIENENLLRSKSMLMATVTHDLQTPLGSIIGFHELLKNSPVNPRQEQYLKNIKESADYILKLVNDLLDFSRLENNKITIDKKGFNMKRLIENTCKTLEPIADNKNIELTWDIDEEINNTFYSDPYRIKQVLTNLVSNAVKFTSEGTVEVTAKIESNKIVLSVIDTGIGIAGDKQQDVFREFTQAHSGIEKKFGGTGLGLTISKKILELLEGEITLESEEGQGSIFTILLPCEPCEEDSEIVNDENIPQVNEYLKGKKILAVDDDSVQIKLMKELFANYPLTLRTEANAANVIALLENEAFDLVLTDIQMPVLDGFELVKTIRSHNSTQIASLPVIALSGKRDLTKDDFIKSGFTASHPKPINFSGLLWEISIVFGNSTRKLKQVQETQNNGELFNLSTLAHFTQNDADSLKNILRTFIESAHENCDALSTAAQANNTEMIAQTAHKMIPMLKQMEVFSISSLLEPLEDRSMQLTKEELLHYINDICKRMDELCKKLETGFV